MSRRVRFIVSLFVLSSATLFSQENFKKHMIKKGETITSIAEKYEVNPSEIYKLNPNSKNLLQLNSVIFIPSESPKTVSQNTKVKSVQTFNDTQHEVAAKETLYGIARQYGTTVKDLNNANPQLANSGLQIGQKIIIPISGKAEQSTATHSETPSENKLVINNTKVTSEIKSEAALKSIEVSLNDTKYSIARQYGISIKEFNLANPTLGTKSLKVGQIISLPANAVRVIENVETSISSIDSRTSAEKKINSTSIANVEDNLSSFPKNNFNQNIVREVLPKETKFGIAKEFGISVAELEKQNPTIKNGLPVGYKLSISSRPLAQKSNQNEDNIVNKQEVKVSIDSAIADKNTIEMTKSEIRDFVHQARNTDVLDQLIEKASENIGTRYQTGGTSKSGFDCSGLMCTTFSAFDIKLPRSSIEQSGFGTKVEAQEAQKGDLIFFNTNGKNRINHVGMVVDVLDGEIKFIHASVGNGVIISSTKENYYKKKVVQVNRVL